MSNNTHSFGTFALWSGLSAAFLIGYLPVWQHLVSAWATNDDYSHGFAIVPLTIYIFWSKRQALMAEVKKGPNIGLLIVIVSLLLNLFASAGEIQTLRALTMLPFLVGAVLYLFGVTVFRMSLFPLALLVFMIPIPAQILAALTVPLQLIVTKISGILARGIGIPLLLQGNLIHIPAQTFEVVQACSGLRSIMTLATLGAFMGYFTLQRNWQRAVLLLSALPIAIAVNIVRVFAMVAFSFFTEIDLTQGAAHTAVGLIVFMLSLALFFLIQKGLAQCSKA
jgi:exosortase